MTTHELKIHPSFFEAKLRGVKPWEYRVFDRDFKEGDTLVLREYEPKIKQYTGRKMTVKVLYMISVSDNYVIMSDTSGGKQ